MASSKKLISIVGPTAVGKTKLGILLAKHFNTDVISADSRQFYKEMTIGTAKPQKDEMDGIVHHFVDTLSISQTYTAGDFERDALALLSCLFQKHDHVVMVGGSGMYVKALCEGLDDMPEPDEDLRERLNATVLSDYDSLLVQLLELDPDYYASVDKANTQRVVRALEVCIATGKPFSSFRKAEKKSRDFEIIKIGLERDRDLLYDLIDQRMDQMLADGLLDEAKSLYGFKNEYALQTIGYSEIYGFLDGLYDWQEGIRLLKRNSRRYAKKQLTWFKKDPDITWFDLSTTDTLDKVINHINLNKQSANT